jgi:glycerophosphoryl diester phosphodiesterase
LIAQTGSRILVHGHRGARAIYPENTIPAFTYAIETGADALEMDLAVTKDNVLVVSHDPYINPEICAGPHPGAFIRRLTLAELREYDCGALKNPGFPRQHTVPSAHIPTLEEVLGLASRGSFQFDIEIKSFPDRPELTPTPEVFARLVLEEIRTHRLETRVVVQSFDFRVLHAMKRLAPEIRLAALWEGDARPFDSIARVAEAHIVSPEFKLVMAGQVRAAHAHNLPVVPWTANTAEDWQRLIDAGVDGIITDDPAALIGYLKENGLR